MPVNSNKNKKTEKDIKKAVDKIPGLIFEQVEFKSPPIEKNIPPKNNYKVEKKKKTLVWSGVIILTLMILIMWSWNTFVNFDTLLKKDNPDSIINQAKDSFEKTKQETKYLEPNEESTTTSTEEDNEKIENKIKESLSTIINNINSTATSTTSSTKSSFPISDTIDTSTRTETYRVL